MKLTRTGRRRLIDSFEQKWHVMEACTEDYGCIWCCLNEEELEARKGEAMIDMERLEELLNEVVP